MCGFLSHTNSPSLPLPPPVNYNITELADTQKIPMLFFLLSVKVGDISNTIHTKGAAWDNHIKWAHTHTQQKGLKA